MNETNNLPPTLDVLGAADVLKVHPQSVLDLIAECAIPAGKVGRSYVMMTKDVLAYAEKIIIDETAKRMRRVTPAANEQAYSAPRVRRR